MFSKFLYGKDEDTLAAMKIQWNMEFSRATRKILKKKKKHNSKGRRLREQVNLNALSEGIDLTKLATLVATTRDGRRMHQKVTENTENNSHKVLVCFCFVSFPLSSFCFLLSLLFFIENSSRLQEMG